MDYFYISQNFRTGASQPSPDESGMFFLHLILWKLFLLIQFLISPKSLILSLYFFVSLSLSLSEIQFVYIHLWFLIVIFARLIEKKLSFVQ